MCGIAGFLGDIPPSVLHEMTDAMAHRGPDGPGTWHNIKHGIGLAHRRLSILDLSDAAAQPMHGVHNRYAVVFNGEIYNFKEIYAELKNEYSLNPHSDTSVLAPLYDKYGPDMLHKLNGMFSFAIWDKEQHTLFLARDHVGIKPLYYTTTEQGAFAFASEIKTLLCIPGVKKRLNKNALADYLTYLWSPGEQTPLQDVVKLNPGHAILLNTGDSPTPFKWYSPPLPQDGPQKKSPQSLQELLDKVVKDQCISDAPVGAFLSGGVDSSAIVASMVAQKISPERSYCMTFHGSSMKEEGFSDDVVFAREIASHLGIKLTEVSADPNGMDRLPALVKTLEEPLADPAPLYVQDICAAARADGLKVLMSGTGGDDVFAGYRRHQAAVLRQQFGPLASPVGYAASAAGVLASGNLKRRLQKVGYMLQGSDDEFLHRAFEFSPRKTVFKLLGDTGFSKYSEKTENSLKKALRASKETTLLNRLLFMEFHGFLPDHNLTYTDKAAMQSCIEVRVPLIDIRLLDYAQNLPQAQKVTGGRTKVLLKQAIEGRLPAGILDRPKAGFGAPIRQWLCHDRQDMVEDIIFGQTSRERGLIDLNVARKLYENTKSGRVDGAYTLLSLMMIELWCREFL